MQGFNCTYLALTKFNRRHIYGVCFCFILIISYL